MNKPNILFLFPDQHRRDWFPYSDEIYKSWKMQKPDLNMPNLENLQKESVTFTNAITPSPLCAPARACLAAGVNYSHSETLSNSFDYPINKPTFYSALKNQGYHVCGVGKFDLQKETCDWFNKEIPKKLGFTEALDNEGKLDALSFTKKRNKPAGPYMKYLNDNGLMQMHIDDMTDRKKETYATPLPDEAYCDNWITSNALDKIKAVPVGEPWFLQVNFAGPHSPFDITKSMEQKVKNKNFEPPFSNNYTQQDLDIRKNYCAMIENIDNNIGKIIDLVKSRGEFDNTVIVYASDHGEMLGDHERYSKGVGFRGALTIPMMVRIPNNNRKGEFDNSLVELQDLAKTFTDIAHAEFNTGSDSKSLLPLLNGKVPSHRDYQISGLVVRKDKGFRCILDKKYKYICDINGEKLLYDIESDPWEGKNIINENPEIAEKYENILNKKLRF